MTSSLDDQFELYFLWYANCVLHVCKHALKTSWNK